MPPHLEHQVVAVLRLRRPATASTAPTATPTAAPATAPAAPPCHVRSDDALADDACVQGETTVIVHQP